MCAFPLTCSTGIIAKIRATCLFLFSVFLAAGLTAAAQERILSYDILAEIEKDGTLRVSEQIRVVAEGNAIKRGIYRSYPTKYTDRLGNRFRTGFEVVEVLRNGSPEPWFVKTQSNGVVVYIGDTDTELIPGTYDYTLVFKTTRQIGFFDGFDELYYNAIGGDWSFSIEKASVKVRLPEGAEIIQKAAWSGYAGSTGCDCELVESGNTLIVSATRALQPREQLTLAVAWPAGFVHRPSATEKIVSFLRDNLHVLFALAGLLMVLLIYYRKWKEIGKDPARGTIIPLFDPPANFSPGETAYLTGMGLKDRVMSSALVNMAVKGYLTISQSDRGYSIGQPGGQTAELSAEEKAIASALFSRGPEIELDDKNYRLFGEARKNADKVLREKMIPVYFSLNTRQLLSGFLLSVVWTVLTFMFSPSPLVPVILIILLLALAILFAWLIKAPTVQGRVLMDEAEGFKMYLSVAEKDRLNMTGEPGLTAERFEKYLPYAIALGVENEWGRRFENALKRSEQDVSDYRPAWYTGPAAGISGFSPQAFSSGVGRSFSSAISSASTPPGSSSGSGGGGSSGGGGGGGGGGGW
jgi:hypothetical protein